MNVLGKVLFTMRQMCSLEVPLKCTLIHQYFSSMNFQRFLCYENILNNEMLKITLIWFSWSGLQPFKKIYIYILKSLAFSADYKYQQKPINLSDQKHRGSEIFRLDFNASQAI